MKSVKVWIFLAFAIFIASYILFSPSFEREKPKISDITRNYWNPHTPIKISISDNTGIKRYIVKIKNLTFEKSFDKPKKDVVVKIVLPSAIPVNEDKIKVRVEAWDGSKWNFLKGNFSFREFVFNVDCEKPGIEVISHSYGIGRGGSAALSFRVYEKNLKRVEVVVNREYRFKVFPFNDNKYLSVIAWPVKDENFICWIEAEDKAGNISRRRVKFFLKKYKYRESKIKLSQRFIEGKVREILEEVGYRIPEDFIERFKLMNENLRNRNEEIIEKVARDFKVEPVKRFKILPFKPLKNAACMAKFGDHRFYYFKDTFSGESWHLGIDLASLKNSPIVVSNDGVVQYAGFTGIYGNVIIIYHGLGISSLYAHCSCMYVKKGDKVKKGDVIGKTGSTGAVFGDHLHFGILVQGVEVQPLEWMDPRWIRDNILKVLF